jgi:UDP-N-acetyl-D-galactosamine dehydrogenase
MEQTKTVSVIGLGYVGLPLAVRCQERGYQTIGLDIDEAKMALLRDGKNPFQDDYLDENLSRYPLTTLTTNAADIAAADIHIIAVPTPVDAQRHPDLTPVIKASETVAQYAKKGSLVILESTVNPYVSEESREAYFRTGRFYDWRRPLY